jgi:hypothetical protein
MSTVPNALPPVARWRALAFQLLAFTATPAIDLNQNWWHDLTGSDPEQTRKRGLREEKGVYNDFILSVTTNFIQVVWQVQPNIVETAALEFPVLGPYPDARQRFVDLMMQWLPSCPPTHRIAFVTKAFLPRNTRDESYVTLGSYLDSIEVDPSSHDFMYRINRKRDSAVINDRDINRLSTWQSVRFLTATMTMGTPALQQTTSSRDGCMIDLDINTSGENTSVIPHDSLVPLFLELSRFADEIVERGDVP